VSEIIPEVICEFQEALAGGQVRCHICPHECTIAPGHTGICLCRKNFDGTLRPLNYGQITATMMDPMEKKPLYHFFPGSKIYSIGTWGCNFKCDFCQNWNISQQAAATEFVSPEETVQRALAAKSIGIAYTYNEPMIWFEYVRDTAKLARAAGLKNVLVTNGYVNEGPLDKLLEVVDAMNIDLKGFTEEFYQRRPRGRLSPVLETAVRAAQRCHVETTTLLIPGQNDFREEIIALRDWIYKNLGPDSPTHVSAYTPRYKAREPATSPSEVLEACKILEKKLHFVYAGNIVAGDLSNTRCYNCGAAAVQREGYHVKAEGLSGGACASCGQNLKMVVE
jgi:pyruvate formate lyase activating enzyme